MNDIGPTSSDQAVVAPRHATLWRILAAVAAIALIVAFATRWRPVAGPSGTEAPRPDQTVAGTTDEVDDRLPPPFRSPPAPGRSGLASIIGGPDGAWRLSVETAGSPDIAIEHALVMRRADGGGKKVLATVVDSLDPQATVLAAHEWEPAGWSADGSRAYVASRVHVSGGSIAGMLPNIYGNDLYVVNVATLKMTKLATFGDGTDPLSNGLVAVAPIRQRVAYVDDGVLHVADLDGAKDEARFTPPEGKRVWQAMFDPKTDRVALLLAEPKGDDLAWTAGTVDAEGAWTDLGPSTAGGLIDWTDKGLTYLAEHPDGRVEERQHPAKAE